jgi:N-methylhydantoinase A
MVSVIEEIMAGAMRRVSIEQGVDPRGAVLMAFGGAGGIHATSLARSLDMVGVLIPPAGGVLSALGMLLSPPRLDAARSVLLDAGRMGELDAAVADVRTGVRRPGTHGGTVVGTAVDVRYRGQSHELTIPYEEGDGWSALAERFHDAHEMRNGFSRRDDPIEAVTVRAWSKSRPAMGFEDLPEWVAEGDARLPVRTVMTPTGPVEAGGWRRSGLSPGAEIAGPAVIEEREATTFIGPGERAIVHPSGALEVTW